MPMSFYVVVIIKYPSFNIFEALFGQIFFVSHWLLKLSNIQQRLSAASAKVGEKLQQNNTP